MDTHTLNTPISALLEMGPMYHRLILNKLELNKADLGSLHITRSQFFILLALMGNDTLNMTQLSSYIASSKEQATRAVAPLVEAGYVHRFHDETNRKLVLIQLTPAGKTFLRQTKQQLQEALEKKFEGLTEEDRQELVQSLHNILRILKKIQ